MIVKLIRTSPCQGFHVGAAAILTLVETRGLLRRPFLAIGKTAITYHLCDR
ncbi:MAG: hypothetical protein KME08_02215 [Aphanothece sp. CMT-3BRIN-NPC111]|nr:hypothetical protein [Aphanothece sp. CMT-3BRIN-NPC111]